MLKALQDKKAALVKEAKELLATANANDDGNLTAEQETKYKDLTDKIASANLQISRLQAMADEERSMAASSDVSAANDQVVKHAANSATVREVIEDKPFESLAEQLNAIRMAASPQPVIDPRLSTGAAAGASSSVPSDGGFLIQQDFATEIVSRSYEIGAISSRVRRVPVSGNGLKMNAIDESSRANGSRFGGVQAYWEGEGDTANAKKPKFRQMDLKLNKLIGLMYATDELLQDAAAFDSVARQAFADEVNFMVEESIVEGNGAGKPLGFTQGGSLVTVSKETGQAAQTLIAENIIKMWSRCWGRSRQNAVWLINQDIEPQLFTMSIDVGTGGVPIYQPANGLSGQPFSTLLGRPVVPVEHAATIGTVNDIMLVDLSQYLMIDKGGAKQDVSMHVRFIYDESAYRIVYRCDGQPIWNTPLTPKNGSNTLSPFVTLATRS